VGEWSIELDAAATVKDAVEQTKARFGPDADAYQQLSRVAAVAVNGVLINYRKGMKTRLQDGDTVAFVKAAAGG
jgi:molybdopterin converting factor small subunit